MTKRKPKQEQPATLPPSVRRDYAIPGVETHLCSEEAGMDMGRFVAIAVSLASANPDAKIAFQLTIKDPNNGEKPD
jgi:hypothetical protein